MAIIVWKDNSGDSTITVRVKRACDECGTITGCVEIMIIDHDLCFCGRCFQVIVLNVIKGWKS